MLFNYVSSDKRYYLTLIYSNRKLSIGNELDAHANSKYYLKNLGYSSSKPIEIYDSNSIKLCEKFFQVFLLLIFEYMVY